MSQAKLECYLWLILLNLGVTLGELHRVVPAVAGRLVKKGCKCLALRYDFWAISDVNPAVRSHGNLSELIRLFFL